MKKIEETLGWTTAKMLMLVTAAYLLLHSTACVFFLASKPYYVAGLQSWVTKAVSSAFSPLATSPHVRLNGVTCKRFHLLVDDIYEVKDLTLARHIDMQPFVQSRSIIIY
eukprot:scaffold119983_cov23-Prasinocladus_malaysianus.AAC.1